MQTVEERREKYLQILTDAIELIRDAEDVPQAAFVQVLFSSGQVVRLKSIERGVNSLVLSGMLHTMATEISIQTLSQSETI